MVILQPVLLLSVIHLIPPETSWLFMTLGAAVPSTPDPTPIPACSVAEGSKGQTLLIKVEGEEKWHKGDEQGKNGKGGVCTIMKDGHPLCQHPPTCTYSVPSTSLVKEKSAGKDLPSVNDGYLWYSDAVRSDSPEQRFRGCRKGASSLHKPIRTVNWQSDIIRPV